ncbi:hypothetical protein TrRE_jg11626, partial [Triparma retinervis]
MSNQRRTLTLRLVCCRGLLAADKGGTSDPYVTVQILERGTGKPVKKEVFKSKTKKKTVDPVFDEASRTPPLGFVTLPLEFFGDHLVPTLSKHELARFGKMKCEARGQVEFTLNFNRPETKTSLPPMSSDPAAVNMSEPPLVIPDHVTNARLDVDHPPNELHVMVIKASS